MPKGLGLIHVQGSLCKYESKGAGNRRAASKAGQFVRCRPAGKRGYMTDTRSASTPATAKRKSLPKRRTSTSRKGMVCQTVHVKMFGQGSKRKCRTICRRKGKIVSNKPCKRGRKR